MIAFKQPTEWSCLPTAFAMAVDMEPNELISKLPLDGNDEVFTDEGHWARRGWHSQEIIQVLWREGFSVTQFSIQPILQGRFGQLYTLPHTDLKSIAEGNKGVAITNTHAYAWGDGLLIDPKDTTVKFWNDDDPIVKLFLVDRRRQKDDFK